jgi:hypothetical protein
MWNGIESVRWTFIRLPWLKVSLVALSLLLLIGSGFWVWRAFTKPLEWQETTTLATYRQDGEFYYQIDIEGGYLFSTAPTDFPEVMLEEKEGEGAEYFTNIIEEIEVSFTYEFVPDYRVNDVNSEIDIFAIIQGPSGWQKEILLKSDSGDDSCTTNFPLDLESFDEIINDVEDELGVRYQYFGRNVYDLVLEARVAVSVDTGKEWMTDTFVQPMKISIGAGTLTWDKELSLDERRYRGEFSYKHVGNFGYTIYLTEETALYGAGVTELSSEPYEPPAIISRPPGEVYFLAIVDIMKSSFSYSFVCNQPVTNMVAEVEVIATLEYSEMWQKTFTLVPKTESIGNFVLNFPVDINYFAELANVIRDEIGMGAATHDLTIEATVHTKADTQFGPIDEVFSHTLIGSLGMTTLTWGEELEKSEEGTIEVTEYLTDPDLPAYRLWSQIVTGLLLLIFLFVLWHAVWARTVMSKGDEEAARAKKKHKKVIVDIEELPPAEPSVTVVSISSLDELIKAADNLLKPVLHQVQAGKHTYCVIDGLTRYEYIRKRWPPVEDE